MVSKKYNFHISGKYFDLQTKLEYLSDFCVYDHLETNIQRKYINYGELSIIKNNIYDKEKKIITINKLLQENYNYLGLSFDRFEYINSNNCIYKNIEHNDELNHIITHKYDIFHDVVYNAIKFFPIIPSNIKAMYINRDIFRDTFEHYIKDVNLNKDSTLIIGGELIWSGWLTTYMLYSIIRDNIKSNCNIIIDNYAIWEKLLDSKEGDEIHMINNNILKPNITILRDEDIITKDQYNFTLDITHDDGQRKIILDKYTMYYSLNVDNPKVNNKNISKNIIIDRYNYSKFINEYREIDSKNVKSLKSFEVLSNTNYSVCKNNVLEHKNNVHINLTKYLKDILVKVNLLNKNELDIILSKKNKVTITLPEIDLANYQLFCNHLQYLNNNDLILKINNINLLKSKNIYAPNAGLIDLTYLSNGIIFQNIFDEEYKVNFEGINNYLLKGNNHEIYIDAIAIKLFYSSTKLLFGKLVHYDSLNDVDLSEKIVCISNSNISNIDYIKLINCNVKAILLINNTYANVNKFIRNRFIKAGIFEILIATPMGYIDEELYKLLYKFSNQYAFVNGDSIYINEKQKIFTDELYNNKVLTKGSRIKYINYDTNVQESIIESINNKQITINDGKNIINEIIVNII
jgi:hypothetical protein